MEGVERLFKLLMEIMLFCLILSLFLSTNLNAWTSAPLALFLAHTLNWLFNGHLFVLGRYIGFTNNEPRSFIEYPGRIRNRLMHKSSIDAIAFFGSLSREGFSPTSDLDMRVIPRKGVWNAFVACFWTFVERATALLNKYPLDVYVVSKRSSLDKLRADETPVILFDHSGFFNRYYTATADYQEFKCEFLTKYAS